MEHLDDHPELLRLDALGSAVPEKNMAAAALLQFKRDFTARLSTAGSAIERSLGLVEGRGVQLLMRTYALTRGLWQSAQHEQSTLTMGLLPR